MVYKNLNIIPTPKSVDGATDDGNFESVYLQAGIMLKVKKWRQLADAFLVYAKKAHRIDFEDGDGGIEIRYDRGIKTRAYRLDTTNGALILASDQSGAAAALSTLLQLIKKNGNGIVVPKLVITDYPNCSYRGLLIDVARKWHPVDTLYDMVDLCFLYKANYLQLHLTDKESYTLPSAAFPALSTPGRHYTKNQISELVKYASDRSVTLVPELETPGHSSSMIRAYPAIFGNTDGRPGDNIICAGKPGVFDNIDRLIGEVCKLFPESPYIHIGGDEAQIGKWEYCDDCRAYMREHSIPSVKALYTHFVGTVANMVIAHGRKPIVWEGFPKEGLQDITKEVIVMPFESLYHLPADLAKEGFRIINTSWKPLYITPDKRWTPHEILAWNVYNWQHWWEKSEAYLNPIYLQPTSKVVGGQLCVWENTYEQEIMPIMENLPALIERTWSIRRYITDEEFMEKLKILTKIAIKIRYSKELLNEQPVNDPK